MSLKTINFYTCILTLVFFNQLESSVIFGSKYSMIKIDSGATCIIENPLYIENGVINTEPYGIVMGSEIIFDNSTLIDSGNKIRITATIGTNVPLNGYGIFLNGSNSFSGRAGTLYEPICVNSKDNLIQGNLTIYNDITLQDSNASVSVDLLTNLNGNIYLNGGMVCLLENSLKFKDGDRIVGPGTIYETGGKIIFGASPLTFSENMHFIDAEDIKVNSNITLQGAWTFSGNATIDGSLNSLYLSDSGSIIVDCGASLLIKNITIHGIQNGNIYCKDNNGTITFQNVNLYLEDDYTFSIGRFAILDQAKILGSSKFIYQSPMESTILSRSTLTLDAGITFSYDPGCMRSDLIVLQDPYSTLELNGATLHATLTGMQLANGFLLVSNNSYLSSEQSPTLDQGITFGDGFGNDLALQILTSTKLEITRGSLKYKNIIGSSCIMQNMQSILQLDNGCNFYLYQNLNLGTGQITFMGGNFYFVPGKLITGSTNVCGTINYVEL